ncbi:MAG: 2Fe-2S iron-sulfur cluster-binding protein [Pseudomonadota bacterium]
MKHFQPLTVVSVRTQGQEAVRLRLDAPPEQREQFTFRAGQHVPVRARVGGRTVQRTYSICSPPGVWPLELGVRVQAGGRFSEWAAQTLQVGDELLALPPVGAFVADESLGAGHRVAIAAGSGITPILAIITELLEDPTQRVTLLYGNRTLASTMFVEELWALKNRHLDRLALHFVFSREPQGEGIYEGRLDGERVGALWQAFCVSTDVPVREVFVCGPGDIAEVATAALEALGVNPAIVKSERFTAARRPKGEDVAAPAAVPSPAAAEAQVEVELIMDGKRRQFTMPANGSTVLEGAERAGLDLPFSCRGGVCATCRTHVREGSVEMAVNYGLEPWELERGFVLACQAAPTSERIVLDYDLT